MMCLIQSACHLANLGVGGLQRTTGQRYLAALWGSGHNRSVAPQVGLRAPIANHDRIIRVSRQQFNHTVQSHITEEMTMKLSARNALKGTVKRIVTGAVNAEVVIELPGGVQITSIVTKQAITSLGLAEGQQAYAIIKASNVMLGVDH